MRGYFGIGVEGAGKAMNVGNLFPTMSLAREASLGEWVQVGRPSHTETSTPGYRGGPIVTTLW